MINNNTQNKPTTTNTPKTSESTIYLKKSELPSNVSSFKNDAGYITSSALIVWLKEHSYIPKSEINTLISKVDISNKSVDTTTVQQHTSDIGEMKGEIVAIKDLLGHLDDSYITIDKVSDFATKTEIEHLSDIINGIDLSNFAVKDEIPSVEGLASETWVQSQGYLTEHQSLDAYATKSWVEDKRYLTEHQDISGKVDRSELDGLASQVWVTEQGYIQEIPDIYVKKSDLVWKVI